jgi:hypothetical protein
LTILELLDALEIGIVTLCAQNEKSTRNACGGGCAHVQQPLAAEDAGFVSAETLRIEMERSAVTPAELTKMWVWTEVFWNPGWPVGVRFLRGFSIRRGFWPCSFHRLTESS